MASSRYLKQTIITVATKNRTDIEINEAPKRAINRYAATDNTARATADLAIAYMMAFRLLHTGHSPIGISNHQRISLLYLMLCVS
jgi:hypothetical protein